MARARLERWSNRLMGFDSRVQAQPALFFVNAGNFENDRRVRRLQLI